MAREGSAEAFVPPTVRAGETLLDSYTFHSSGEASTSGDERARADEAERARRARILAENAALRSTGKEKLVLGEDGDEMLYERPEERGGAGASDEDDDEVTSLQTSTDGDAWIIGIDEAGRGPVLGPQVYALAYCRKRYAQSKLAGLGFADSKTLTDDVRCELFARMLEARDEGQDAVDGEAPIKYAARIMSPHDISKGMLSRTPYNLNAQSHDATMGLIRDVLARGFNVTEAYVDTVGQADSYRAKLSGAFPTVNFTVTSKADSLFPIVSAASVVAKVTRDKVLDAWTFSESTFVDKHGLDDARTFGSGYPSDPNTVGWLERALDPVFGYPTVVRFSWQTVRTLLTKRAHAVRWTDEPAPITSYFSASEETERKAHEARRNEAWRELKLAPVSAF